MTTPVAGADGDAIVKLPTPDPAFHWTTETWGHALRCKPLSTVAQHVFTTRQLQLRGREPQELEWRQAAAAAGASVSRLLRVKQVHGRAVRIVRGDSAADQDVATRPPADAIVSDASGWALSVQIADCVPILMFDRRRGVAAAVHAGWRGTCAGVASASVEAMTRDFGTRPADVMAAIGPSIGPCCYEVGADVRRVFLAAFDAGQAEPWFAASTGESIRLDLWTANRDQLIAAGLGADDIYICRLCTRTHHELFASYRAEGEKAGRMAALITVP